MLQHLRSTTISSQGLHGVPDRFLLILLFFLGFFTACVCAILTCTSKQLIQHSLHKGRVAARLCSSLVLALLIRCFLHFLDFAKNVLTEIPAQLVTCFSAAGMLPFSSARQAPSEPRENRNAEGSQSHHSPGRY